MDGSKQGSVSKAVAGRERALGFLPGQPFLLRPDGSADVDVLSFFVSSSFGLLSDDTQLSYAKDVRLFLSFLSSQQISWRDARYEDLLDYEFWRCRDTENPRRVCAAKFSREWAACRKFYDWQLRRGAVAANPLLSGLRGTGVGDRSPRPSRATRSNRVKWLTPRAFEQWRNVGLAGLLPDGSTDPMWRGRNMGRNVAFANLLWASGLRLREAATLLVMELPAPDPDVRYLRARVGQAVAKGRGRDFWIAADARTGLEAYVLSSRAAAIKRAQREDRYDAPSNGLMVLESDRNRLRLRDAATGGEWVVLVGELNARERAPLVRRGPVRP